MKDPQLIQRAVARIAEQRIREAMEEGRFQGLRGTGRRLPELEEPYEALWWVRRWLKRERVDPARLGGELRRLVDEVRRPRRGPEPPR